MACTLSGHPELGKIERDLAQGIGYSKVAHRYYCTKEQVRYYAEHCMSEELKDQRFNVLRKRMEDQIAGAGRRIVKNLPPALAEDLLKTLEGGENCTIRTPKNATF
jgi:hypothetical protein